MAAKITRADVLVSFDDGTAKAWKWIWPRVRMVVGGNFTLSGRSKGPGDLEVSISGLAVPVAVDEPSEVADAEVLDVTPIEELPRATD